MMEMSKKDFKARRAPKKKTGDPPGSRALRGPGPHPSQRS
jgi:hypothetical protein